MQMEQRCNHGKSVSQECRLCTYDELLPDPPNTLTVGILRSVLVEMPDDAPVYAYTHDSRDPTADAHSGFTPT